MKKTTLSLIVFLLALHSSVVAENKGEIQVSGFLGDYSDLEPQPGDKDMLVYRKAEGVLEPYDKFVIDPVLIYFHPEAKGVGVDPAKLAELAVFFREAVVEELGRGGYQILEEPASGVARVRAAITDVNLTTATNVATKAAGMAAGVGFLIPNVDVGGASIEVEILDSQSNERLVAVVDAERGRRFLNVKGMKKAGDARKAFKGWAREFRERLDRVHRRK